MFSSITISPSYGKFTNLITWTLKKNVPGYEVYILRSYTGTKDWVCLNENRPVTDGEFFEDNTFYQGSNFVIPYYRLFLKVLYPSGKIEQFDSDIIGLEGTLTKAEYGALNAMIKFEYLRMRGGNGVLVAYHALKIDGELSNSVDPLTLQQTKYDCPEDEDNSYNQTYAHGYAPPVWTYIELKDIGPQTTQEGEDAVTESQEVNARFLPFPVPKAGDLIVHPYSDSRWAVGAAVRPFKFKGIFPVAFSAPLLILPKRDSRYLVSSGKVPKIMTDNITRAL